MLLCKTIKVRQYTVGYGVEISSCTGCWCPSSRQKCWEKQGVVPCCGAVVLWCCWCWSGTEVVLLRRGGGGDAFYSFYSTSSDGKHACSPRHLFKLLSLTRGDQFPSILQTLWYQHSTMVNTIELETNLREVWSFTIREKESRCEIGLQAQQRS